MTKVAKGGTDMWCPECGEVQTCKAIPVPHITFDPSDYAQRWRNTRHGINWFQRGRECQVCGGTWITAEVVADYLSELMELRDALADLKQHAEAYSDESEAAERSLKALRKALGVLRALD